MVNEVLEVITECLVPLNGVKKSTVDIFCTKDFIKINYPPFLFEVVLFQSIDDDKSVAKIKDACVVFTLVKEEPTTWSQLASNQSDNKSFVLKKKQEAIEYAQKKADLQKQERDSIKDQTKKYSLKEMMKLEEHDRSRIEEIKEHERVRTMKEMEEWKEQKRLEAEREKLQSIVELNQLEVKKTYEQPEVGKDENIFDEELLEVQSNPSEAEEMQSAQIIDEVQEVALVVDEKLPPPKKSDPSRKPRPIQRLGPRESGKISVKFTPRVFPTPQRESKTAEENEWLQKQASSRKQFALEEPDLAEHEKDPIWLKDKGNQLYASENYLGAINAYNLAVRIQPGMPILFLNRAACHLKLKNLYKCAEDCSSALEIMKPKVKENAKGRFKGHLRRAAAFCELELYVEALQDYEAALEIEPKNAQLIEDAAKLRHVIENST